MLIGTHENMLIGTHENMLIETHENVLFGQLTHTHTLVRQHLANKIVLFWKVLLIITI